MTHLIKNYDIQREVIVYQIASGQWFVFIRDTDTGGSITHESCCEGHALGFAMHMTSCP